MRLANVNGRVTAVMPDGSGLDVHRRSAGSFGPDPADVFARWDAFRGWASEHLPVDATGDVVVEPADLRAPSPEPRQIIAFGLNYSRHAAESGFEAPTGLPPVFPKFVSSLAGAVTTVTLPEGGKTDWEIELVAVIGRAVDGPIDPAEGWDHVAGLTVGQDLSDRALQFSTPAPQFGLAKSYPGFAPTGPWLVTVDEFADPDSVRLHAELDGEIVQEGVTSQLLVSVPRLIAGLSEIITLFPGDIVFTGTPDGVGHGRKPPRYLQPGQELVSTIEGIGSIRQNFV